MENKFYVYLHIRLDNGQPFYVGKGHGNRYFDKKKRSEYWKRIVNKVGYDVVLLEENLTESESFEKEIYWIDRIGRQDLGTGPLVNFTKGGTGCSGLVLTDEYKKEMSDRVLGEKNPMYGRKHSEETKRTISEKNKGKEARKGILHSQESKDKISKANTGKKHTEEVKAKMSRDRKGRKMKLMTQETKDKISESLKIYAQKRKNNNQ